LVEGKLIVVGWDDELLIKNGISRELKVGDEILTLNGRSVHKIARENLIYTQSGTFLSRLEEAYFFILSRTHAFFRQVNEGDRVELLFKRDKETFSGHLSWLKRSVWNQQLIRFPEKYKPTEDQKKDTGNFTYGSSNTVRSFFREGVDSLKLPMGSILDIGAMVNNGINQDEANKTKEKSESKKTDQLKAVTRLQAYTIKYKDKNIAVLRIPSYSPGTINDAVNELKWIEKVLTILQQQSDYLIIDQVSNGGGYVYYVNELIKLFAKDKFYQGVTSNYRLTQTLLNSWEDTPTEVGGDKVLNFAHIRLNDLMMEKMREKLRRGEEWTGPLNMTGDNLIAPDEVVKAGVGAKGAAYTKPVMIINNTQSGSGGDFFPALMRKNGFAWMMGSTSMGLGGPVYRSINSMPGSEMFMRCTAAECAFSDGTPLENVGAVVDVRRDVTLKDVKEAFKGFSADVLNSVVLDMKKTQSEMTPERFTKIQGALSLQPPARFQLPEAAKVDPILISLTDDFSIYLRLLQLEHMGSSGKSKAWIKESIASLGEKLKLSPHQKKCSLALIPGYMREL
jgi:C-terminal processing protease CtpA/Prc